MLAHLCLLARACCVPLASVVLLAACAQQSTVAPTAAPPAQQEASASAVPAAASLPIVTPTRAPAVVQPAGQPAAATPIAPAVAQLPVEPATGRFVGNVALVDPLGQAVPAVDVPKQLAFSPQRGGGATHFMDCAIPNLAAHVRSLYFARYADTFMDLGKLETPRIDIGKSVLICYAGFTPGPVIERIIRPDGSLARYIEFTIDPLEVTQAQVIMGTPPAITLAANDFAALPEDMPGVYTVVASTADGDVAARFEVTDKVDISSRWGGKGVYVAPLGHGITVEYPYEAEYVMLKGFAPSDAVDIYFFESCAAPPSRPVFKFDIRYTFVTGFKSQVDANGQAFARIPKDVAQQMKAPPVEYVIVARGAKSPAGSFSSLYDAQLENGSYKEIEKSAGWYTAFASPSSATRVLQNGGALPACPS
jgi:hypothetical protein